jgi:hypothetical protein
MAARSALPNLEGSSAFRRGAFGGVAPPRGVNQVLDVDIEVEIEAQPRFRSILGDEPGNGAWPPSVLAVAMAATPRRTAGVPRRPCNRSSSHGRRLSAADDDDMTFRFSFGAMRKRVPVSVKCGRMYSGLQTNVQS